MLPKYMILISAILLNACASVNQNKTDSNGKVIDTWDEKMVDRLEYVGVILEDPKYHIWGVSPIWGDDGKVHIFCSRIPIDTTKKMNGFGSWARSSQIAHYVGDTPEGPFKFQEVTLPAGSLSDWDSGTKHNPIIRKVGDTYALFYQTYIQNNRIHPSAIGLVTSKSLNGPWGPPIKVLGPSTDPNHYTYTCRGAFGNPAYIYNPENGKHHLYFGVRTKEPKRGVSYGVAIADKLEGPYKMKENPVINNPHDIEDPYGFYYQGIFYLINTENKPGTGLAFSSAGGLNFKFEHGEKSFGNLASYVPQSILDASPNYRGQKFERPGLLLKNGIPTHLYVPSGSNIIGGDGTCAYLLKIKK